MSTSQNKIAPFNPHYYPHDFIKEWLVQKAMLEVPTSNYEYSFANIGRHKDCWNCQFNMHT